MIWLDPMIDARTGQLLAGFFIRDAKMRLLAIGARGNAYECMNPFVKMAAPRYERDLDLVKKVESLVGLPITKLPDRCRSAPGRRKKR